MCQPPASFLALARGSDLSPVPPVLATAAVGDGLKLNPGAFTSPWRRPWFRPGRRRPGSSRPFLVLYALHDALVKPIAGPGAGARAGAEALPNPGR